MLRFFSLFWVLVLTACTVPSEVSSFDVLYVASSHSKLEVIEPVVGVLNGDNEKAVIASPSKRVAACFMMPEWDSSWCRLVVTARSPKEEGPYNVYMIISDRERFVSKDRGGAIYTVSPEGFASDSRVGLQGFELISKRAVIPKSKTIYKSAVDAMKEAGVKLRFVTPVEFETFLKKTPLRQLVWLGESDS